MNRDFYQQLFKDGLISPESMEKISHRQTHPLVSVHWELKTILYLGVMLLSTGLGILIYQHIDTIGHQVILFIIAVISAGCFAYCMKKKVPFSRMRVKSPGSLFDYLLLLGCISFVTFVGYLQFQYAVFGTHYGMATLLPMIVLFIVAYQFDHLGILGMAITNLGLWMGLTVSPFAILSGTLYDGTFINSSLLLGLILLLAGYLSGRYGYKAHFKFSYQHFGLNIAFISLLSEYAVYDDSPFSLLWLAALFGLAYLMYHDAFRDRSFYFLLLVILYAYIAASILILRIFGTINSEGMIMLIFLYFILSATGLVMLLININKKLREI